jgi:hypothetical protein
MFGVEVRIHHLQLYVTKSRFKVNNLYDQNKCAVSEF